jgi:bla regulator protein blaR1
MSAFLELILSNALATAILAIMVSGICRFIQRPIVRNLLWLVVLVRLFLPPIWTIPIVGNVTSIPESHKSSTILREEVLAPEESFDYELFSNIETPSKPTIETDLPRSYEEPVGTVISNERNDLPLLLFGIWFVGSVSIAIRAWVRIRRFQRCMQNGVPAPDSIQDRVRELALRWGIGSPPEVWIVPGRIPPLVWAPFGSLRRSKILLPARLLPRLNDFQLDSILGHELSHLRRHDSWIRLLELMSILIYWWHPMLGWIRRQLRDAEEQCCDAYVVEHFGDRKSYATALVETVLFLDESAPPPLLTSGAAPIQHLQRRISMIMRDSGRNRFTRWSLLAALLFAFASLGVGPSFTQAQPDRKDPPRKEKALPPDEEVEDKIEIRRGDRKDPEPKVKVESRRRGNEEDIEQARRQVDEARRAFERANRALRDAEERLAQVEGRRGVEERRVEERRPPNPDRKIVPDRGRETPRSIALPDERRVDPPLREGDRLENLERQLQRLAQELETMRREMRRPDSRPENNRSIPKKENRDEPDRR